MSSPTPDHAPRPDASMDLLRQVRQEAMEPDYLTAEDRHGRERPHGRGLIGTLTMLVLAGLLLGGAWRATTVSRPATVAERDDLINRVQSAQAHRASQQAAVGRLQRQVDAMRASQSAAGTASARISAASMAAGQVAVSGPGVRVHLDDSPDGSDEGRVGDQDLRQLINGLWQAGAEAISVNGHRITTRTAVRSAGSAITVDYVSIARPYRVNAIGDPNVIPGKLSQNGGGQWMAYIADNFGVRWSITTAGTLKLPAGEGSVSLASPR
ncbi:DUF881 domain-containing protein [Acidipropionibacterium jensenii]|uniref:DUF881 domain-containing protein n=1 Tax=Acidipropionibacterium jensenii TaxID=1749 RepID=A0A3Q9UDV2_9ACTN|nr:DUF881 domain-containing protein [Acidipropionibacterium jensenii]AZZ39362.1 DUF881 domain-containing protein [Acidipropionibacterium jensenii]